jgi:hypothetical protein
LNHSIPSILSAQRQASAAARSTFADGSSAILAGTRYRRAISTDSPGTQALIDKYDGSDYHPVAALDVQQLAVVLKADQNLELEQTSSLLSCRN